MAIRRPLKLDSGNLRDLSSAEMELIVDETIRQYGQSPSVALTINQGNGNLANLTETRATAGEGAISGVGFPDAPASGFNVITYNNTVQTITDQTFPYRTGTGYENYSYPIYRTASNDLQAMSAIDMYDTFIAPAIAKLVLGSTTSIGQAGTFFISSNSSESDATQIGSEPVFTDTSADITAFAGGSLGDMPLDQALSVANFWLHQIDPVAGVAYVPPVSIKRDTSDLISTPKVQFGTMMQNLIDHYASTTLRYNYYISTETSFGVSRGSGITDTYTTGFTPRYEQVYAGTYYAQNVPSGTPTVQSTHYLRIGTI